MRKVALEYGKPKLLAGVMLAALLSACSSDASRFSDDPFGNPFKGSSRFESNAGGPVRSPANRDLRRSSFEPVTTGSATTQALSGASQAMPAPSTPLMPSVGSAVQGLNPSAGSGKLAGKAAGAVAAANYPSLAPVAQRSGSALSAASGWTAVGGTPVTLGAGESIASLSGKYGVPASAILAVNGMGAGSKLSPGQQIMIPAYNAVQGNGGSAATIARPLAAAAAPKAVEKLAETRKAVPQLAAPASAPLSEIRSAPAAAVVAQAAPRAVGPARQVGAPVETEAEKRAAAKLRELKGAKPAARDDDEDDDAPASKKAQAPKAAPVKAEDAKLKAARMEAEKAKLEAEKAKAEAARAKAEAEKARVEKLEASRIEVEKSERARASAAEKTKVEKARLEKAKADKVLAEKAKAEKVAKAEKLNKAKKAAAEDDVETTASIPATKMPERAASVEPKLAARAVEPKAQPRAVEPKSEEKASETASADTFRWPAKGRVISGFGARGTGGANDGINIAVPEGTPVRAAEGGTVVHADDALKGYGKMVLVRHSNGYVSVYAHNGELNVKRGETVKRGQVIAHSGASGNVTSPQLHFELRKGSTPVDPSTRLAD